MRIDNPVQELALLAGLACLGPGLALYGGRRFSRRSLRNESNRIPWAFHQPGALLDPQCEIILTDYGWGLDRERLRGKQPMPIMGSTDVLVASIRLTHADLSSRGLKFACAHRDARV